MSNPIYLRDAYLCNVPNTSRALHFYSICLSSRTRLLTTRHKRSRDKNRTQNKCSVFLYMLCSKSPSYRKFVAIPEIMVFINPRFVRKKARFCWCCVHYIEMSLGHLRWKGGTDLRKERPNRCRKLLWIRSRTDGMSPYKCCLQVGKMLYQPFERVLPSMSKSATVTSVRGKTIPTISRPYQAACSEMTTTAHGLPASAT